jgi:PAS domain S-box-containing protein
MEDDRSEPNKTAAPGRDVPLDTIPLYSTNLLTVLDEDGTIRYESPSIERVYGFDQDELVGTLVFEYLHPEDREDVVDAFETITSSEEYAVRAVEYRHEQADGTYKWVESIASVDPTPEGRYVVNTREISERKQREKQLERFRRAVEATAHAVFITDPDGTIEYVNRAFTDVTGYEPRNAIGRTPRILKSGEMPPEYYEELWETIRSGDTWSEEVINRRKSGERYHASQTISPITDDGEVSAFVAIQADISDQKELEKTLRRQNDRLDQFSSVVSHDLRNPLNVAMGRVELAHEECNSEHLEHTKRAHDRMESLIENLLTLARGGGRAADFEPVVLATAADSSWANTETKDATLVVEADRTIRSDGSRLEQLFENLYRNAVEHGSDDVTVTVGTLDDGFYVADDGPGVPEDDRDEVFEVGHSTSRGGTGFGLAIVERIVGTHGWEIRVTESASGGARFEITGVEFAGT